MECTVYEVTANIKITLKWSFHIFFLCIFLASSSSPHPKVVIPGRGGVKWHTSQSLSKIGIWIWQRRDVCRMPERPNHVILTRFCKVPVSILQFTHLLKTSFVLLLIRYEYAQFSHRKYMLEHIVSAISVSWVWRIHYFLWRVLTYITSIL